MVFYDFYPPALPFLGSFFIKSLTFALGRLSDGIFGPKNADICSKCRLWVALWISGVPKWTLEFPFWRQKWSKRVQHRSRQAVPEPTWAQGGLKSGSFHICLRFLHHLGLFFGGFWRCFWIYGSICWLLLYSFGNQFFNTFL